MGYMLSGEGEPSSLTSGGCGSGKDSVRLKYGDTDVCIPRVRVPEVSNQGSDFGIIDLS